MLATFNKVKAELVAPTGNTYTPYSSELYGDVLHEGITNVASLRKEIHQKGIHTSEI